MSRSIKKTPKGWCAQTESRWKRLVNRSHRRKQRSYIHIGRYDEMPIDLRETSEHRTWPKDGIWSLLWRWNQDAALARSRYKHIRRNVIERKSNTHLYWDFILDDKYFHYREIDDYKKDMRPGCIRACGK